MLDTSLVQSRARTKSFKFSHEGRCETGASTAAVIQFMSVIRYGEKRNQKERQKDKKESTKQSKKKEKKRKKESIIEKKEGRKKETK